MFGNRRNFIFRVSIVINIAVILYAAMQLSGTPSPTGEWVPITADGTDRGADVRFSGELLRSPRVVNDTEVRSLDSIVPSSDEYTSQKTPSTTPSVSKTAATNKTASSTVSVTAQTKKSQQNVSVVSSEPTVTTNESVQETQDDTVLTATALARVRTLVQCTEKEFEPEVVQRGDYWMLKNYVRAEHGPLSCHETVTYTTHAGFEFLDNVQPLVER